MKINFNPHINQTSPKGRPFRLSGLQKVDPVDSEWNAFIKHDYIVSIKYLDDNTFANLKVDNTGKILKILQ